jgi:hypothetical protein
VPALQAAGGFGRSEVLQLVVVDDVTVGRAANYSFDVYSTWKYFRGLSMEIFFFITNIVTKNKGDGSHRSFS